MFTGLVQALGIVLVSAETTAGRRLTISLAELVDAPISPGDSVCVSGVCLTVAKRANGAVQFDVITETLKRTTLGRKKPQDRVNLELSLRGDSYVGGHFVQGHVDAIAKVTAINRDPSDWRITFQVPQPVIPCIIPKGSVAVEGVSMTIAEAAGDLFTLAVIPTTLEKTTLSSLEPGDQVNLETDILARTVVHYLQQTRAGESHYGTSHTAATAPDERREPALTLAKLRELGMT
jgi:riboflavin synthase